MWEPSPEGSVGFDPHAEISRKKGQWENPSHPSPMEATGVPSQFNERRNSGWQIPVFLQIHEDGKWADADGIEIRYFSETIRARNTSTLEDFDVHNPWDNPHYSDLPSVLTDRHGLAKARRKRNPLPVATLRADPRHCHAYRWHSRGLRSCSLGQRFGSFWTHWS